MVIVSVGMFVILPVAHVLHKRVRLSWQQRFTAVAKITIAHHQILSVTRTSFQFEWPKTFQQVLEVMALLGLDVISATQCKVSASHGASGDVGGVVLGWWCRA